MVRLPVPEIILPADQLGQVHFVGIGGAGLSAIARIMLSRGITVTGSDGADSPTLTALRALGATAWVGHQADHIEGADTLIVSTAVREDNPELIEARRLGLRLLPRSAGQASVMADRQVLAIAGTHGKTTTTSLLTMALQAAGSDPSYTIGGELAQTGGNAHDGADRLFVAEADESDGAFLVYAPFAAGITNVEPDHLDVWGTERAYRGAFSDFLGRIDPGGFVVCCTDDPGATALADEAADRGLAVVRVGTGPDCDLQAVDLRFEGRATSFTVLADGVSLGRVRLQIPGQHYVLDALVALAIGLRLGFDFARLTAGLGSYAGTRRRMEHLGTAAGIQVYDSYAHHPVEIAGDLQAARAVAGEGRVIVAFQPHLVSRTRIFGAAMGVALGAADEVVVLDVYLAREDPDPAVTGALVADAVPLPAAQVTFQPSMADVPAELVRRARPGDLILTLGAGDVTTLAPRVLELLS